MAERKAASRLKRTVSARRPMAFFKYAGAIGAVEVSEKGEVHVKTTADGINFSRNETPIRFTEGAAQFRKLGFVEHANIASDADGTLCLAAAEKKGSTRRIHLAVAETLEQWKSLGALHAVQGPAVLSPTTSARGRVVYFGYPCIYAAFQKDDNRRWIADTFPILGPRTDAFDRGALQLMGSFPTKRGTCLVYQSSVHLRNGEREVSVGGAIFSPEEPQKAIWRSEVPWYSHRLTGTESMMPLGVVEHNNTLLLYWNIDGDVHTCSVPHPFKKRRFRAPLLTIARHDQNPILRPNPEHSWEAEATFNPAALYEEGKIHLVYRAVGNGGMSVFGYASTTNGWDIDERIAEPIYYPRAEFEGARSMAHPTVSKFLSGPGWGGCEDPKLTCIDDRVYMTYVAFDGWSGPRAALTSIAKDDFLNKRWNWKKPMLISAPGVINKSACLLPEKINGKYVMFHRVFPNILIDFLDDLEFKDQRWLEAKKSIPIRPHMWDSRKVSVGGTPIKVEDGWLIIYHAVDDREPDKYKIGAMIVAHDDPSRVLYRTHTPILSPDVHYENDGKPGIVYPCGAVVKDGELLVYYGGADKVVCLASAPLEKFLDGLRKHKDVRLTQRKVQFS